jgi:hypothetical protein
MPNHLEHPDPLSVFLTVRERDRHYRELSLVNDHQSDLEICDDPYAFYAMLKKSFIVNFSVGLRFEINRLSVN